MKTVRLFKKTFYKKTTERSMITLQKKKYSGTNLLETVSKGKRFYKVFYCSNEDIYPPGLIKFSDSEFNDSKFCFTDSDNLVRYGLGEYIREITLPYINKNINFSEPISESNSLIIDNNFKLKFYPDKNLWMSDQIIIGENKHCMKNLDTYFDLELPLTIYAREINSLASLEGRLDLLEKMRTLKLLNMSYENIFNACRSGKVDVLNFWANQYDIYDKYFLTISDLSYVASSEKHFNVLNWMVKNQMLTDYKFKYSEKCVDYASKHNHIDILNWWVNYCFTHNCNFKYSNVSIDSASEHGNIDVLIWWEKLYSERNIPLKYSINAVNKASLNGHTNVLQWWLAINKKYNIPICYDFNILTKIDSSDTDTVHKIGTVEWWLHSGLHVDFKNYYLAKYTLLKKLKF